MKYRHFAILTKKHFEEFNQKLSLLERECEVVRKSLKQSSGNSVAMSGDTYEYEYEKKGKYATFEKELKLLWENFNNKYPKTVWKGK